MGEILRADRATDLARFRAEIDGEEFLLDQRELPLVPSEQPS